MKNITLILFGFYITALLNAQSTDAKKYFDGHFL